MPIVAWYALAVSPAVALLLIDGARMLWQRHIRRRMNAATRAWFETQAELAAAKAEARNVIRLADRRAAR